MRRKSYRGYGHNDEADPFGATFSALCIVLAFASPWLLVAYGLFKAWRWLVG